MRGLTRLALALLLFAPIGFGCGARSAQAKSGPHVVLIVVDTLRADRLEQYGYDGRTSSALAGFAAQSTRFEQCYAPSPWTTPSTATILTGLHPLRHGSTQHGAALGDDLASLAELASEGGWRTAGFSFNHNVSSVAHFDQGFEHFEDFGGRSTAYPDIEEMTESVQDWLDAGGGGGQSPFLLYMQPMNAHGPYLVPEAHRPDLLGRQAQAGFEYYGTQMRAIMKKGRIEQRDFVSQVMLESLSEQYDVAVRYTMDELGRFLEGLKERGLYDESLIILTADHGEELFEHGGFSHGYSLHEEVLHVPLMIKLPAQQHAQVVDAPVSLADIYPTVADALGVPMPYPVDGQSLLPLMGRGIPGAAGAQAGQLYHVDWKSRCVARSYRLGRYKLIRIERNYAGADDELLLFDLVEDPTESHSITQRSPKIVERLLERMEAAVGENLRHKMSAPGLVLDDMDAETLRQLGYL